MIMRIFQVTTQPGKAGEFGRFFHGTALPLMRRTEGLVDVWPGTPRADSPDDFCMVMLWRDLDALKAFAGEDYANPHILPEEAELVAARSISHYEFIAAPA